jgi:UDP-N-acetylglucosamine--N-acetylmuramyl-(pentapeptide) pyrophosphoryl-undecaprenol N-acetylglucosamine transferase
MKVERIVAGKLRRYYHMSVLRQLLWPKLVLLNARDSLLVAVGFLQSFTKLVLWRPDVVFTKGGYVCLPVGMAVHLLRIPLVIHDSDAHPGLTNRVLSRWASGIATGAPLEYYSYPKKISRYVGIPIREGFVPFTLNQRRVAKKQWGVDPNRPLIVITGGGLGAQRINDATASTLAELMELGSVVLISGAGQYDQLRSMTPQYDERFQLHAFVSDGLVSLFGAADVAITRAGATTILELAALRKPTILVPNGKLTGGHQLKNAQVYKDAKSVLIIDENAMEKTPLLLRDAVKDILNNPKKTDEMAGRFMNFARPNAANDMADMILGAIRR